MVAPTPNSPSPRTVVTLILPGPDCRRSPTRYRYRVRFRNPFMHQPGCVMTWDVLGGRDSYQIAAERTTDERLEWHCTCPDAVYRSARQPHHRCKHVQGLLAWLHQRETKPLAATSSHNG